MKSIHLPSLLLFGVTIWGTFNTYPSFRLSDSVNKTGVVFAEDVDEVPFQPTLTTSTPLLEENTVSTSSGDVEKSTLPAASIDDDRRHMLVANSNLPRFDPKKAGGGRPLMEPSSFNPETAAVPDLSKTEDDDTDTLRNATTGSSQSDFIDACQFCPDGRFLQHYFAKGCIAMDFQDECMPKICPTYFDCPKEKETPKDGCMYEEKVYKFGENVPHRDPCQHCICINSTTGPMLSCATSECFNAWTPLEPNCYRNYTEGKCCPEIECTSAGEPLGTCTYKENVYTFGDYFSPEGDPCYNCQCDERWNMTQSPLETVCTRLQCRFDFGRPENKGCVPVYSDKTCCPLYLHCPDESAKTTQPKCKFAGNFYEIGEQIKVKQHEVCLECSCLVPPEITCKHKSCPTVPTNCTTEYIEGECCPKIKCETEDMEILEEGNSSKDTTLQVVTREDSFSVAETECPPVGSCLEPCKLITEEVPETGEQSESQRCPKCQCAKVDTARQEPADNGTGPCDNSKVPCARTNDDSAHPEKASLNTVSITDAHQDRWGKSTKTETESPPVEQDVRTLKLRPLRRRCPDVFCAFPCYIYRVGPGDCPRCSCPVDEPSSSVGASESKVQYKFVTSSGLTVQDGHS